VQENELTSLPPEIGALTALRKLYLEYNKLTDLPAEIAHLKGLAVLILHHNQLKEGPHSKFLEHEVSHGAVPVALLSLKQLLRLSLEDNPLPADVLSIIRTQGALAIIAGCHVTLSLTSPLRS
jgi:Leucine-rich repeat (LRR) protein